MPPELIIVRVLILGQFTDRYEKVPTFLAFDLGAESGRAVLGCLDSGRLKIKEIHRFPNGPIQEESSLHWMSHDCGLR